MCLLRPEGRVVLGNSDIIHVAVRIAKASMLACDRAQPHVPLVLPDFDRTGARAKIGSPAIGTPGREVAAPALRRAHETHERFLRETTATSHARPDGPDDFRLCYASPPSRCAGSNIWRLNSSSLRMSSGSIADAPSCASPSVPSASSSPSTPTERRSSRSRR
jgi:hypothetical protein